MGYQIAYKNIGRKAVPQKKKWGSVAAASCVAFLLAGAITVKSVGLTWVKEFLIPGDPTVTAAALENMVQDIRDGGSITQAVTVFCQEIIKHGQGPK